MSGESMSPEFNKAKRTLEQLQQDHKKLQERQDETKIAEKIRDHIQNESECLGEIEDNPYAGTDDCCTIL